jgi:hypothetical protein
MSYKVSSGKLYINKAGVMSEIDSVLVAAGWTNVDTYSHPVGGQVKVYGSNGETRSGFLGDRLTEYIWIWDGYDGNLCFRPYKYWDGGSDVGYGCAWDPGTDAISLADSASRSGALAVTQNNTSQMYMYASKNLVFIGVNTGTSWDYVLFGHFAKKFWTTEADLSSGIVGGTGPASVSLTNVNGAFKEGGTYQIIGSTYDNASSPKVGGRQLVTVTNVGPTSVTLSATTNTYATGSKLGEIPSTFGCTKGGVLSYGLETSFYLTCPRNSTGLNVSAAYPYYFNESALPSSRTGLGYDYIANSKLAIPIVASTEENGYATVGLYNDEYILFSGEDDGGSDSYLRTEDTLAIEQWDSGTIHGTHTEDTMEADAKAWGTNEHAGRVVLIITGQGVGQIRTIVSNTATVLTVTPNWTYTLADNGTFIIATDAYRGHAYGFAGTRTALVAREKES